MLSTSMLKFSVLLLLAQPWACTVANAASPKAFPSEVPKGDKDNPGAVLRITENGFDYVVETMGEVMDNVLRNFKADKIDIDLGGNGDLTLRNFEIYEYQGPDYIGALDTDEINLKLKDIKKAAMRATIDATLMGYTLTGPIGATLYGLNADITAGVTNKKDKPSVNIKECTITVKRLVMDLSKTGGSGAGLARLFRAKIEQLGKDQMGKVMCDGAKTGVEEGLNNQFEDMAGQAELSNDRRGADPMPSKVKSSLASAGITKHNDIFDVDMSNYEIDYRFARNQQPEITKTYIQTAHRAEISHKGKGGVPFYAEKLPPMRGKAKHLFVQLSDYVWNSLLYSMHKQGDLDIRLKESKFVGNHLAEEMPYCLVTRGRMVLRADGKAELKVYAGEKMAKAGKTELKGDVDMEFKRSGVSGELKVDKFALDGITSSRNRPRGTFELIVKEFFDELLLRGVPADIAEYSTFQDSEVNISQGHVLGLETNIKLNKKKIAETINAAILNELSG